MDDRVTGGGRWIGSTTPNGPIPTGNSIMRWKSFCGLVAVMLGLIAGCKQQCFIAECDYEHSRTHLAADLTTDPTAALKPASVAYTSEPATVLDPGRQQRFISLAEAISIALEQGNTGSVNAPDSLDLGQFNQQATRLAIDNLGSNFSDSIRVFAMDPAIFGAQVERAVSQFDAIFLSSMNWTATDTPIGTALQAFQAGQGGINAIETEAASLRSDIVKPLPTGGVAGITFQTDYQFTNLPARVNPSYTPQLTFAFEQPLLQQFGTEINQITSSHPGSILFPNAPINRGQAVDPGSPSGGGRTVEGGGILITRIRFDQSRAEFEKRVNALLINVESAYWNLYSSYWTLYSREQALRQAYEAWKISNARFQAGRIGIAELAQTRGQYELFRSNRISALGVVLENERQLRKLMGMPAEDQTRLVPSDKPTLAPYKPDWHMGLKEAMAYRPALRQARDELRIAQLDVMAQRNRLLPDLRFSATYNINAIGSQLDGGNNPNNALKNFTQDDFNNWSLGLTFSTPIGRRDSYANLRVARLNLGRAHAILADQELKVQQYLTVRYRRLLELYEQIKVLRAQREAFAVQLRARFEEFNNGRGTVDILLEAQRFWADALAQEYANISTYNSELAGWEYAKGTILRHNSIVIGEGELPHCAMERAVEHHRKRTHALVLKEREAPVPHAVCEGKDCSLVTPELPTHVAPSLPALLKGAPKPIDGKGALATPFDEKATPIPLVKPKKIGNIESLPAPKELPNYAK